ncbi:MAG TPA: hypothetical protein VN845_04610 [Solirubrobacteraceae bacterium]|nr:hypothetical protein [Solirubrobacteraceae bacterium]
MTDFNTPIVAQVDEAKRQYRELSEALWAMTPAQRQAAMWAGELTQEQLYEWASRARSEVPLIDGEFAFIAMSTPEVAELMERSR